MCNVCKAACGVGESWHSQRSVHGNVILQPANYLPVTSCSLNRSTYLHTSHCPVQSRIIPRNWAQFTGCCIWFLGFVNSVWWSSIIHSFLKIAAHFGSTNARVLHHCRICLIGSLKVENIRLFSVGVLYQTFLTPSQEWRLDEVSQNPKALQPHAAPFSISTLLLQSPCPPIQVPTLKLQGDMVSSSCPCPGTLSFHQEPQGPVLTCPSICSFVPNEILCFNLRQWVLIFLD